MLVSTFDPSQGKYAVEPMEHDLTMDELYALSGVPRQTPCGCVAIDKVCYHKAHSGSLNGCTFKPGTTRKDANVEEVSFLGYDFDGIPPAGFETVCATLAQYDSFAASTHSHRDYEYHVHVTIALSRPIKAAEYPRAWVGGVKALGFDIPSLDTSKKNPSCLFYTSTNPPGVVPISLRFKGAVLDVDHILTLAPDIDLAPAPAPYVPLPPEVSVDVSELRDTLVKRKRQLLNSKDPEDTRKGELLGCALRGEALALTNRNNALHSVVWVMGHALPETTPTEAALVILRESITAMGPSKHGDRFEHAEREFREAKEAALALRVEQARVLAAAKRLFAPRVEGAPEPPAPIAGESELPPEDIEDLIRASLSNTPTGPKNSQFNLERILTHHPAVAGTLRYNEVKKTIDFSRSPFRRETDNTLPTAVSIWTADLYNLHPSASLVVEVLLLVAQRNSFDPLKEHLRALKWDGTPRIDTWLSKYCHADGSPEYLAMVGSRALIAMVARGLRPGCKLDTMLVFHGKQGAFKSSAAAVLGGPFYSDTKIVIGDKDSYMAASKHWIIEFAELSSIRRADVEATKAFLSASKDNYRPPYGRVLEETDRRCAFFGTTNDDYFLTDDTGNRRFLAVRITKSIDIKALKRDRDQLLAEAIVRFDADASWWFDENEQVILDAYNERHILETPFEEAVREWVEGKGAGFSQLSALQILKETFPGQTKLDDHHSKRISNIMKKLGYVKERDGNSRVFKKGKHVAVSV